jgi:uncharacterized protein with PIN domain
MAKRMSRTTFIDTQYVVALVNERDQFHEGAVEISRFYVGHSLVTTDAVLLEIGNALARSFREEAVGIIERFLTAENLTIVRLTPDLFEAGLSLFKSQGAGRLRIIRCNAPRRRTRCADNRSPFRASWI